MRKSQTADTATAESLLQVICENFIMFFFPLYLSKWLHKGQVSQIVPGGVVK